jgi:hypothetical protein
MSDELIELLGIDESGDHIDSDISRHVTSDECVNRFHGIVSCDSPLTVGSF